MSLMKADQQFKCRKVYYFMQSNSEKDYNQIYKFTA